MSHAFKRLSLLGAIVVAVAFVGSVSVPSGTSVTSAQGGPTETPLPGGPIPCDPHGSRRFAENKLEGGSELQIEVEFNFTCTGEDRKVNFLLVVENTANLRGTANRRLNSVKEALTLFVNMVNYRNGSRGGLVVFADEESFLVPLIGGDDGKDRLLNRIATLSVEPIGNSAGAGAAIRQATGSLPTGIEQPEDTTNVIVFVDAGAAITSPPLLDLGDACRAAHEAGVHMIVIGLIDAGYRNAGCATPGWVAASTNNDANDVTGFAERFGKDLLEGLITRKYEYVDAKRHDFEFVQGSGQPDDPYVDPLGDLVWEFNGTAPPGGHQILYKIKVPGEDTAGGYYLDKIEKVSISAAVWLHFGVGVPPRPYSLENPEICIYRPGDPSFCEDKLQTATPTSVTATPSATSEPDTPTPTDVATTEVPPTTESPTDPPPTVTPTPTDAGGYSLYLPYCRTG